MASILIVDDNKNLSLVLCDLFEDEHKCDTAATAEEALRKLEAENYDLIITDLSMPGMSGEDLLAFVRASRPTMPVIFITGSPDRSHVEKLIRKGAVDYLLKPFPFRELREKVARALG